MLDFGAGKGDIGRRLRLAGVENLCGHDGSESKVQSLTAKGDYQEVFNFIVGKQRLPREMMRKFDIVTCSENLGSNLFLARCFNDMLDALKPGGYAVFTLATKHIS